MRLDASTLVGDVAGVGVGDPDQPRDAKGRWVRRRGNGLAAAITLAVALAAGTGFGAGGGGAGAAGANSAVRTGETSTSARATTQARRTARASARLVGKGMNVRERSVHADTDCAAHSYGQVQEFFRSHPCTDLVRVLLEVTGKPGARALVAIAWVDMPDAAQARQLQQLMDRPGTGNVTELSRESGGQRFGGEYYRSVRDGDTVVNAQAEPVGRTRMAVELAERAAATGA